MQRKREGERFHGGERSRPPHEGPDLYLRGGSGDGYRQHRGGVRRSIERYGPGAVSGKSVSLPNPGHAVTEQLTEQLTERITDGLCEPVRITDCYFLTND